MKLSNFFLALVFFSLVSCIQEDIVDNAVPEKLRIISSVNTLKVGDVVKFQASYFNNVGEQENKNIVWETSNPAVLSIDELTKNITAQTEGTATITVKTMGSFGELTDSEIIMVVKDDVVVMPSENTKQGTFIKKSSYDVAGDFEIIKTTNGIKIVLASNYVGDEDLPGFVLYLTNNPNSLAGALEVDAYNDADGAHYKGAFTYDINGVGINDYEYLVQWCKPFSVLVGEAIITDI